jgi:vancomycin resistance protein VanW
MSPGAPLRAALRRLLPLNVRQDLAAARRAATDAWRGFAPARSHGGERWPECVWVRQEVRGGADPAAFAGKRANLARASADVDGLLVNPCESWSFWATIGRPTAARGYAAGRTIIDGVLTREAGGGLCQLSGLLYHLALLAGLDVIERHAHSLDLYHDQDRVTPLGADATVVWGHKDLRLRNPHPHAITLRARLVEDVLIGAIGSEGPLAPADVCFERVPRDGERVEVRTYRAGRLLTTTEYLRRPGLQVVER